MLHNSVKFNETIIVMYHYVRCNKSEDTPNLSSLNIDDFKTQLDWLEKNFEPMGHEEFTTLLANNKPFPGNRFLLTFDDGIKDHFTYVFPELKKRKLWGFFFVSSQPYLDKKPLAVHVTHMIINKIGPKKYSELVYKELEKYQVKINNSSQDGLYRYDDDSLSTIKKLMNYDLDYSIRDKIIDDLIFEFFDNGEIFCNNFYCSEAELKEMQHSGMILGSHTHSHKVLSRLNKMEQYDELKISYDFVGALTRRKDIPFCFPYGHKHTYNAETLRLLKDLGYQCGFNTSRGTTCPRKDGRFELSRYDTVDLFPFREMA